MIAVVWMQRLCGVTEETRRAPKVLHYIFEIASFLGEEEFYLVFIPILFWNCGTTTFLHIIYAWLCCGYIGEYSKCYFQLPRPPLEYRGHKIIKMHDKPLLEFGLPSTHASMSTMLATMLFFYEALPALHSSPSIPTYLLCCFLLFFFTVTSASRLYMGVHSFMDLVGGWIISAFTLILLESPIFDVSRRFLDPLFNPTHPHFKANDVLLPTAIILGTSFVLLAAFPVPARPRWQGSLSSAAAFLGVSSGLLLGFTLGGYNCEEYNSQLDIFDSMSFLIRCALYFLCMPFLVLSRVVSKSVFQRIFYNLLVDPASSLHHQIGSDSISNKESNEETLAKVIIALQNSSSSEEESQCIMLQKKALRVLAARSSNKDTCMQLRDQMRAFEHNLGGDVAVQIIEKRLKLGGYAVELPRVYLTNLMIALTLITVSPFIINFLIAPSRLTSSNF